MKKRRYTALLLMAALMAACLGLQGQTSFNYVYGCLTNSASRSIIRSHSTTEAVVYYEHGRDHIIALVSLSGQVYEAHLDPDYTMNDIRVVDNEAYFCGKYKKQGFVGRVGINDLRTLSPNVFYVNLDSKMVSELTRMVAYRLGGTTKVAAIGLYRYSYGDTVDAIFPPCSSLCGASVVVECDFSSSGTVYSNMLLVNSMPQKETASDIVETDNLVAVVSHCQNDGRTVVHRCNKTGVLASFPYEYHSYPSPYIEGVTGYWACKTLGDTIAVVDMATGTDPYKIRLRVFDLNSMAMTSFQGYDIPDKSVHAELVYLPEHSTLVTLQNHSLPSTPYSYPFVYLRPYEMSAYNTRVMLENHNLSSYQSLDRLAGNLYVATGGDYWFMKDFTFDDPTEYCYKMDYLAVDVYPPCSPTHLPTPYKTTALGHVTHSGAAGTFRIPALRCNTLTP